jgi:hypothetical protein
MSPRNTIVLFIFTIVLTAALTRYYWPRIEEKVVTVEKEVTHTITRIVKQPDGTTVTEIDKQETDTKKSIDTKFAKSNYIFQIAIDNNKAYFGTVGVRVLGPVFLTAGGSTNKTVSVGVSIEF